MKNREKNIAYVKVDDAEHINPLVVSEMAVILTDYLKGSTVKLISISARGRYFLAEYEQSSLLTPELKGHHESYVAGMVAGYLLSKGIEVI